MLYSYVPLYLKLYLQELHNKQTTINQTNSFDKEDNKDEMHCEYNWILLNYEDDFN